MFWPDLASAFYSKGNILLHELKYQLFRVNPANNQEILKLFFPESV